MKANATIAANKLKKYIEMQQGNMFFSEEEDEIVNKFKAKISAYKAKIAEIEEEIKAKVKELHG